MNKKYRELLTSVDVLNTIQGGLSEPYVSYYEEEDGHRIRARVPGVTKENMEVEIKKNNLSVFYVIPVSVAGNVIRVPQVIYNQSVPHFVNVEKIKAVYEGNDLVVHLPYNERSRDGSDRKIQIEE